MPNAKCGPSGKRPTSSCRNFLSASSNAPDEDHDGCGREECGDGSDGGFRVLPKSVVATDPGKDAVDPSSWLNCKADLIKLPFDDLDGDEGCTGSLMAGIGKDLPDEGDCRHEARSTGSAPSRSWMLAGCGNSTSTRPSVSTSAWRLRPLIFLLAS